MADITIDTYSASRKRIGDYAGRPLEALPLGIGYIYDQTQLHVDDIDTDEVDNGGRPALTGIVWDDSDPDLEGLAADDFEILAVDGTVAAVAVYDAGTGDLAGDLIACIRFTPQLVAGDLPIDLPDGKLATVSQIEAAEAGSGVDPAGSTAGQVLTSTGPTTTPTFQDPSGGGGGGSGQVGSNRVTPADGDTVALSQSVITIVSLPATPGAAVTLTAGSPATSSEFWAILRREAFGFDTYDLAFPGEYHDPDDLLAIDGSATAVVLHLVPDKYGDGTPVWATKIEALEGGAVTFEDLESYAANTLATAEGYTDTAIAGLGTAATKNVGTSSGDVAAGNAPAAAITAHVAATDPHGDRAYTDAQITAALATFDFKASVRAASTSNITLSGAQTIDGVSVVAGNRVLVAGQSTGSQNGIYVAASGAWARAADAGTSFEVTSGMAVGVTEGTSNGDAFWLLTTNDPITLGSTALTFTKLPMVAGLSPSANLSDLTNAATARTNLGLGSLATASTIVSADITDGTVANADLANMTAKTVKMRHTNSTGAPEDTSMANLLADASGQAAADFAWNSHKLTGLTAGSASTDAATVGQVGYVSTPVISTTTIAATSAEATAFTAALPTDLAAGDLVEVVLFGDRGNNSGSTANYTMRLKLGATTLLTTAAIVTTASANRAGWSLATQTVVEIPASAQRTGAQFVTGVLAASTWTPIAASNTHVGSSPSTEDLTSAKNLVLTVQMSVANAATDFVVLGGALKITRKR